MGFKTQNKESVVFVFHPLKLETCFSQERPTNDGDQDGGRVCSSLGAVVPREEGLVPKLKGAPVQP